MTLAGIALRNLAHRPGRTALTLLGVTLAIAAYVALVGLTKGVETTLTRNFDARGADVILTEAGAADMLSSVVPVEIAPKIMSYDGVASASPELGRMTTLGEATTGFVHGWPDGSDSWTSLTFLEGRAPIPADNTGEIAGGVALGDRLAARLNATPGDRLSVFSVPFTVTGIYEIDGLLTRNGAVMLIDDMQAQTYRQGQATSIILRLEDGVSPDARDQLVETLRADFPTLAAETTQAMVDAYVNVRIARILAFVVSTVAVASAALAVLNTMAMAVGERRGEIAIMGAVGWPRGQVIRCLMLEGGWLTGLGAVLGIILGIAVAWGVTLSPQVGGFVEPVISLGLVLRALALGLGIGLIGAYIPAARAASEDPAAILRGR